MNYELIDVFFDNLNLACFTAFYHIVEKNSLSSKPSPFHVSTEPLMFLPVTENVVWESVRRFSFRNAKFSWVFDFERLNVNSKKKRLSILFIFIWLEQAFEERKLWED